MTNRTDTALVTAADEDVPLSHVRALGAGTDADRESRVVALAARMDGPMTVLGLLFALVVLGQTLASGQILQTALAGLGWILWAVFVAEFGLRLYVAPSWQRFLRRNWWQLIFLALPMLRFVRLLLLLRVLRVGRVVSSAVRSSRSARRVFSNRLGWLVAVSAIVVLAASQLLYAFEPAYGQYGDALHAAALAAITGEPLGADGGFARVLEIALAVYSVAIFAAVAGAAGAYFLEGRERPAALSPPTDRR